jgi:hypothetical protein
MKRRNREDLLSESLVKAVKKNSILAEVMLGKIYFSNVGSRKVRKDKVYQASADRLVKICPICELAWERVKVGSQAESDRTLYYKNMPKYGKKMQNCTRCSEEEE